MYQDATIPSGELHIGQYKSNWFPKNYRLRSFVGKITELYMWNEVLLLSSEDVMCSLPYLHLGHTIFSWQAVRTEIVNAEPGVSILFLRNESVFFPQCNNDSSITTASTAATTNASRLISTNSSTNLPNSNVTSTTHAMTTHAMTTHAMTTHAMTTHAMTTHESESSPTTVSEVSASSGSTTLAITVGMASTHTESPPSVNTISTTSDWDYSSDSTSTMRTNTNSIFMSKTSATVTASSSDWRKISSEPIIFSTESIPSTLTHTRSSTSASASNEQYSPSCGATTTPSNCVCDCQTTLKHGQTYSRTSTHSPPLPLKLRKTTQSTKLHGKRIEEPTSVKSTSAPKVPNETRRIPKGAAAVVTSSYSKTGPTSFEGQTTTERIHKRFIPQAPSDSKKPVVPVYIPPKYVPKEAPVGKYIGGVAISFIGVIVGIVIVADFPYISAYLPLLKRNWSACLRCRIFRSQSRRDIIRRLMRREVTKASMVVHTENANQALLDQRQRISVACSNHSRTETVSAYSYTTFDDLNPC